MTDNSVALIVGMIATIVGQIIALLIIMFNARQARIRAELGRKWELEDRAATSAGLHAAINDNTQKTEQAIVAAAAAYTEANHVNIKLQTLGLDLQKEHAAAGTKVEP